MRTAVAVACVTALLLCAGAAHGATSIATRWSNEVSLGYTVGPGAMIITGRTLVVHTGNQGTQTVTGFDAVSGDLRFEVPDGSTMIRSGLVSGDGNGNGLFYQINGATDFQEPTLVAREPTQGNVVWTFGAYNNSLPLEGRRRPYFLHGYLYSGSGTMHVVDAVTGTQTAAVGGNSNLLEGSQITGFVALDGSPVVVFTWLGLLVAYNVRDASAPTMVWNVTKVIPGDESLTQVPHVTPDQRTLFVQSTGSNSTAEGLAIAAISTANGAVDPEGFGIVRVPWGTRIFAVTDKVVLCTVTFNLTQVVAYSRNTGAVAWLRKVSQSEVPLDCAFAPIDDGSVVCVTKPNNLETNIMKIDPSSGEVLYSHTLLRAIDGDIQTKRGFTPIILDDNDLIVLWASPTNQTNPQPTMTIRRVQLVANAPPRP